MQSLRENDYLIQHHQAKRNRWFVFGLVGVLLVVCLCGVTGSVTYALLWRNKVEKYELTFAIVGDFGRGNLYQKQVAQQMGDACQKAVPQCSFIISAGDNFYDYGVKDLQDPLWKAYFEDIYTHPALQKRWFVTLGNHDYLGNVQAQIDYTNISSRWYLPSRYYFHKEALKNIVVDFTFVDSNPFVGMDASKGQFNDSVQNVTQQLQWIREKLSKASNEHSEYDEEQSHWRIVVGHHPLFSAGSHGDTPQLIQQLKPVLDQYKVHTYFSGHDHDLQHIQARNMTQKRVGSEEINPHFVDYFVSGGGSTPNTTDAREGHSYRIKEYYAGSGFMLVRISKLEMVVDFVDTNGTVIYRHVKKHRKGLQESAAVFN